MIFVRMVKVERYMTTIGGYLLKWSYFKSKLLLKYTLSYILIFLVPLIIVTVTVYINSVNTLRSEIEQSNFNQLTQVKMTIDERITELQQTAALIAYDDKLTNYMVKDPYYSRDAIAALERYKASNPAVEDIFLYFRGDDKIYSSRGLSDLKILFSQTYQFESWTVDQWKRALNETKYPYMRPADISQSHLFKKSMLAYLVPIKPNTSYPNATVLFLMEENKLTGIMESILRDFSGSSYIFDQNGEVLTNYNLNDELSLEDRDALSQLAPGIHSLTLNNMKQSVVAVHSEEYDWTYVTAMPSYQFFDRMIHVQTWILLIFLIAVFIGVPVAIRIAKKQYHPIQDLMELTQTNTSSSGSNAIKNSSEWDWIRQTIHDYSARINLQEPYVRDQCLLLLLKHGKPKNTETDLLVQSLGFESDDTVYFVIMLTWDEQPERKGSREEQQRTIDLLRDIAIPEQHMHAYGIELAQTEQVAFLVCLQADPEHSEQQRIDHMIEAIRSIVMTHSSFIPSIGVGTSYSTLEDLNESYIEAATALETRMVNGKGSIIYFDRLTLTTNENFWVPKNVLLKLVQSLKQGNEVVAINMIDTTIKLIQTQALSVALMRCISYDLLNTLLKTANELGMQEVVQDIPSLTSFESIEELELKLNRLAIQICKQVVHKAESEQHSLMDDIVSYIQQQYADYTLSLEHVALKFNISTSYLSRTFKEQTGYNFSQYIWKLRMDEVIKQLLSTNDPLKEIIIRVGYLDTPNFIRKFKKETGYTPGQYRKMYAPASNQLSISSDEDNE